MSKISPVCGSTKIVKLSKLSIASTMTKHSYSTLKLKNSLIKKIYAASIAKARVSLKFQKDSNNERLDTLVSVEREYIQNLFCLKNKKASTDKFLIPANQKTPEIKPCKNEKTKNLIRNSSHCRKISSQRKFDSTCSSPRSDLLSRILF